MWILLFALLAQSPADRVILEAEQAREAGVPALRRALASPEAHTQRRAARALGRLENPAHQDALVPLLHSADATVRLAAASALVQMRAPFDYAALLKTEADSPVRQVLYEAIGRAKPAGEDAEALLAKGLADGSARGLEALFRLNRQRHPSAATLASLHAAFSSQTSEQTRELILLTMNAAGDHDAATLAMALQDPGPLVRRLAVTGMGKWVDDPSPLVRYEALRVAKSCEHAAAAVGDASEHVALEAVDLLGSLHCDAKTLTPLLTSPRSWRIRAHALVSLAAVDSDQARAALPGAVASPVWQARAWAAIAAKKLGDTTALSKLARDVEPNVAIAALTTPADADRALSSSHNGLVLAGAERLKNAPDLPAHLAPLTAAFRRLTATGVMNSRDPRLAILNRIGEAAQPATDSLLRGALSDRDPAIATLAAQFLTKRTGAPVQPVTTKLPIPPLPPAAYIQALEGATARITLRGLGILTMNLLTDEAPVTVATFAQLAEAGRYNGLTLHRVVPNFVLQGGSPGADEYDGRIPHFLRDEPGLARNVRGSIGISTRGRDTGDAQIYFNLIDNFRLDRDYPVMATMRDGFDVMDRAQEGDVIERIEILRKPAVRGIN